MNHEQSTGICPMCGANSPLQCELRDVTGGECPWELAEDEYTPPNRIAQLVAVEAAAKALAHHVRKSINVGPLSKSPAREAVLWRALREALGEPTKE